MLARSMPDPTPRERFIAALERRPLPGRVPHFELVFFLTMEAFGRVHPSHRSYHQWFQMSRRERGAHRRDAARLYIETAERFEHDAILLHPNPGDLAEALHLIDEVRDLSGDRYFLMLHGDATPAIPEGSEMESISVRMLEEPEAVEDQIARDIERALRTGDEIRRHGGLDGLALCADYCFNSGPFLPLDWFDRFVTPHLETLVRGYRDLGFYVIKHTDGNIMPILERLVDAGPHALHSLDPQGGVDIAEVVRLVGDRVCLCGNVDCGLLQTGTDEECIESARYALQSGMSSPGYIFSTSNCIYTGMDLGRYELILDVWRREGNRPDTGGTDQR
jgi:uroporphyrinogen decarboxylase